MMPIEPRSSFALLHTINHCPRASRTEDAAHGLAHWQHTPHASLLNEPKIKELLESIYGNSHYLGRLLNQHGEFFYTLCQAGIDNSYETLLTSNQSFPIPDQPQVLMQHLRVHKSRVALLIAIADITGYWPLSKITHALSVLAEISLKHIVRFLLTKAAKQGDIILKHPDNPEEECGLIVLGMGKLGGKELNYSSDIDLILLYDKEKVDYRGKQPLQQFYNKMAHELVRMMQERTADGYVFRTDLRLRPDPASTPPVLAINGAITYYETVGQNWERAALIKARPVAGDIAAGEDFLKAIRPFIWRKNLDYAAIEDIQSIKRQMNTSLDVPDDLSGHNVKIGIGGIREIEFLVHIYQLLWGGRNHELRTRPTCVTLARLVQEQLIEQTTAAKLEEIYTYLRKVEHRLQMVDDQQTHSLPATQEEMQQIATFMGYDSLNEFTQTLHKKLSFTHAVFSESFQGSKSLGEEGNLVFTGIEPDPTTLTTISKMGYHDPKTICELIQSWHRGSRRATRTKRARELITELTPPLLKAFAATGSPNDAFLKFDEFLSKLPAGVQLFSLFSQNPHLLELIAGIMGSAPAIADTLSKNPHLLDTTLLNNFYAPLPTKEEMRAELDYILASARDFEDVIYALNRYKSEKAFQTGVQLFKKRIDAIASGFFLSELAELLLETLQNRLFSDVKDAETGVQFAVIAMGKLGARELTFASDLDLVFLYDTQDAQDQSVFFNRLAQRYIGVLSSLTKDGRLYEVDTRLRPSGKDGPLAVSVAAFEKYFNESAWTFEFMALTRARVITGSEALKKKLTAIINTQLTKPRDIKHLAKDVIEMRNKVEAQYATRNPWNIKHVRGGMMDVDFIYQFLQLSKQPANDTLKEAHNFLSKMLSYLRLCTHGSLDEQTVSADLRRLLANAFDEPSFDTLKARLQETEEQVRILFRELIESHL